MKRIYNTTRRQPSETAPAVTITQLEEIAVAIEEMSEYAEDMLDAFSEHMNVCAEKILRWLKAIKRKSAAVFSGIREYLFSGNHLIASSSAMVEHCEDAYYIEDTLDLEGLRELIDLLQRCEEFEKVMPASEGRQLFHGINMQILESLKKVLAALMADCPDRSFAMRRKVVHFKQDLQDIIERNESRWEEYVTADGWNTEKEILEDCLDTVENQLMDSIFYEKHADTPKKLVEHFLSLREERLGEDLDKFIYLYAQMLWLNGRLADLQKEQGADEARVQQNIYYQYFYDNSANNQAATDVNNGGTMNQIYIKGNYNGSK